MIVLMGIKHSGKTSLGRLLAKTLDLPFLDLDYLLEEEYSKERILDFRQIYTQFGESEFRNLETSAIKKIQMGKRGILALGGGTIENAEAMEIVKKADTLIFLDGDEQILFERIKNNGLPTFLEESPEKSFHKLFTKRRLLYKNISDITLKIKDKKPEELLNSLIEKLGENL